VDRDLPGSLGEAVFVGGEADVVARMPYTLSDFQQVKRVTGYGDADLRRILDKACSKGLVIDLWANGTYHYMPSPIMVGLFEFSMMRTAGTPEAAEVARLFHAYMDEDPRFLASNYGSGEVFAPLRTLPRAEALADTPHLEVLDYERASHYIDAASKLAIGPCSCRHQKGELGSRECEFPLETCSTFGYAADLLIRHGMAREVSKEEMRDNFERSKEADLALTADNVKKNVRFVCHCCGCCCEPFLGIRKYGYPNIVVTSTLIAWVDGETCTGCAKCVKACPIQALEANPSECPGRDGKGTPRLNRDLCLGCGVCAVKCPTGACSLEKRDARVIHPETTFERIVLHGLENGTLQNQIFDNPRSRTQAYMRAFVGAFLRLSPVKKALLGNALRSSFLGGIKQGSALQRKVWITET